MLIAGLVAIICVLSVNTMLLLFAPDRVPFAASNRFAEDARIEGEISLTAARTSRNLLTYDYRALEAYAAALRSDATDGFEERNHTTLNGSLRDFVRRIAGVQAISTAEIKGTSITSRDDDTATVFVIAVRTVTSSVQPDGPRQLLGLELTLVREGRTWKVDTVSDPVAPAAPPSERS